MSENSEATAPAAQPDLAFDPGDTPIGRAVAELVVALRIDTSVPGLDVALQPYATLLAAMVRAQAPATPVAPPASPAPSAKAQR